MDELFTGKGNTTAEERYVCNTCGSRFAHFRVLHESRTAWDGSFDDTFVCPYCGSEDFC